VSDEEKPPTHVLIGTSDGESLTGERWISLEDFAKFFAPKTMQYIFPDGSRVEESSLRVVDLEERIRNLELHRRIDRLSDPRERMQRLGELRNDEVERTRERYLMVTGQMRSQRQGEEK
jgi:hypothetical protein